MAPIIDPEEDYLTLVAFEDRMAQSDARRKKELDDAQTKLKGGKLC
jgi:kinetochore protein Spc24, fungi type